MRDDHGAVGEGEERRQHLAQCGRVGHHLVGDAGQHRNQRWDVGLRIDQCLKFALHLTTAYLDGSELSDHVRLGAARGF